MDEDVAWVLIVEKEVVVAGISQIKYTNSFQAVFQTLCRLHISKHEAIPGPGLIITVSKAVRR